MNEVVVKPWWQSVSLWLTVLTALGVILDKLVLDGVIPDGGWYAIVAGVIALITKRGLTENKAMEASALVSAAKAEAAKLDPTKP